MINADNFKSDINKLTEFRIILIIKYVIYCYLKILEDKKTYNYSKKGKIPKEEFLRDGLVNDYLMKSNNKEYFKHNISDIPSAEITFHPEEKMTYTDKKTNQRSTDKIDISIWESNLQYIWSEKTDNEIKFAIDCKRIEKLSDANNYISDIEKFSNRDYRYTRLPFEGQIAFIEDKNINHATLRKEINERLIDHKVIITNNFLNQIILIDKFDGTYLSKHQRNTGRQKFSIYHLFFDYSQIVID
jgi:hypothetical protein